MRAFRMVEMACRVVMSVRLVPGFSESRMGVPVMVTQAHDWSVRKMDCSS